MAAAQTKDTKINIPGCRKKRYFEVGKEKKNER